MAPGRRWTTKDLTTPARFRRERRGQTVGREGRAAGDQSSGRGPDRRSRLNQGALRHSVTGGTHGLAGDRNQGRWAPQLCLQETIHRGNREMARHEPQPVTLAIMPPAAPGQASSIIGRPHSVPAYRGRRVERKWRSGSRPRLRQLVGQHSTLLIVVKLTRRAHVI
jgi:hypothetical protein